MLDDLGKNGETFLSSKLPLLSTDFLDQVYNCVQFPQV